MKELCYNHNNYDCDKQSDELISKGYDKQYEGQIAYDSINNGYAFHMFCLQ